MFRFLLSISLLGFILLCIAQDGRVVDKAAHRKAYQAAENKFQQAEILSEKAGDDERLLANADTIYKQSLVSFQQLIPELERAGNDSLAFFTRLRAALIAFYLYEPVTAKMHYLAGIRLKQGLPAVPDSFLFIPYLYTGSICYDQDQLDSALTYYKKAEEIQDRYATPLSESERLYNRLGVIFYENGNYRQARNYFEKAIARTDPANSSLLANYKINTASILVKLEEYQAAKKVYEEILPYGLFPNEIYHNLAIISLKIGEPAEAIRYLRLVNYPPGKKMIDFYGNFAMAFSDLQETDSAESYYHRALAENLRWNGQRKNIPYGIILKYKGDESVLRGNYSKAIGFYQEAVMQFDNNFQDTSTGENPTDFSGAYSYIHLFQSLAGKANALEKLYQSQKKLTTLSASLATYHAAFQLAQYVERTYNSDEARLFLNKLKYSTHSRPIDISLELYRITGQREYLEQAYLFDQRNKASVLSLNMQENEQRLENKDKNQWFHQEAALKTTITRLSLKAANTADSTILKTIQAATRDAEIELGKVQEKINNDPAYRDKLYSDRIPNIPTLQKKLDNQTALLSWHLSETKMLVLLITGNQFVHHVTNVGPAFFAAIDSFKSALHNTNPEKRYAGDALSNWLYQVLMAPLMSKLPGIKRLIIIPDDELSYLPFEALLDDNRHYLVEKYAVQYQFSTGLLGSNEKKKPAGGILAMAPFASRGYRDSAGQELKSLPASGDEVTGLTGMIMVDSVGTKEHFLRAADQYGIIHLATHAHADNEQPQRSYIAFFPSVPDYKLYTQEIYDMKLDSTDLVILSACETGAGKLVKGEGLMSLSRAFAYAGCPNIITSLWKAEDRSTSYLTQRLHHYLGKGYSKDRALQAAKMDLLEDETIDPRLKSPNYWAHLLFIGDYETRHGNYPWWWIAGGLIAGSLVYLVLKNRKPG